MNETKFEYGYCFVANDFTADGLVKPYAYQNIIQSVAERHLIALGLDTAMLAEKNLAFVLVGMTIEVKARPGLSDIITGKTWHSETKGPYYRRDFEFRLRDGTPLFSGASFSVVIDLTRRSIVRRLALPEGVGSGSLEFAVKNAAPGLTDVPGCELCETRKIYPSFLDALGHVNNTRYCELACDALSPENSGHFIERIGISFCAELTLGDSVQIYKAELPGKTYIRGMRSSDGKKSFAALFEYGPR